MILATPGPTPVQENIRQAMAEPTIHHRTKEFEEIFGNTKDKLIKLFNMDEAIMLASTGSGALEASVGNICSKKALVINAGKFGERFSKICKALDKELVELKYEWDTPASLDDVEEALRSHPDIDTLFIQICESAGGLRHPVEKIAKSIKKSGKNIAIVCDGITAVGVEKIDTTNIDVLITGSQKAFMLPPGLAMMGLSELAIKRVEENDYGFYFNLNHELKAQRKNTTAWTAATTLIIGLNKVLEQMFEIGLDTLYNKTASRANALNRACEALGLKIYPKTPAFSMSTIYYEGRANELRKILKSEYKLNVAGGQEHLNGNIFRVNHMGFIEDFEASWNANAIELALCKLEGKHFSGEANRVFLDEYYRELK
ncbi:MAG: pyridoxal-phosphate-dependent aminotransferase family protein [Campylobacterales bacterium]